MDETGSCRSRHAAASIHIASLKGRSQELSRESIYRSNALYRQQINGITMSPSTSYYVFKHSLQSAVEFFDMSTPVVTELIRTEIDLIDKLAKKKLVKKRWFNLWR